MVAKNFFFSVHFPFISTFTPRKRQYFFRITYSKSSVNALSFNIDQQHRFMVLSNDNSVNSTLPDTWYSLHSHTFINAINLNRAVNLS